MHKMDISKCYRPCG